jgi:2-polyprenyl-3-methyl-5-hydroxy-6-metoxy-1,4-benzoquinol methylase
MAGKEQNFPETADIETSSDNYAARFAGSTGEWMLDVQENITLGFLRNKPGIAILDVGGGHGQLAIPLCRDGYKVTVLSSSESCRKRIAGIIDSGECVFKVGNVLELPFPDKSFDAVIAFRMLTHCHKWPILVKELCRTARTSVIVDYPTSQSVNMIAPALFDAKKKIEKNTRAWTLFRHEEIRLEFEKNGFRLARQKKQFFLPMVLHRAIKCRVLSATLEGLCRALGLTALLGSPVILEMQRERTD